MNEKVNEIIEGTKKGKEDVIDFFSKTLQKYHAGKATPDMLDGVKVDCYGSKMPINQVGNINIPDAKQIIVQPWDKSMLGPIEKAIQNANLGFNPINNGEVLRIIVGCMLCAGTRCYRSPYRDSDRGSHRQPYYRWLQHHNRDSLQEGYHFYMPRYTASYTQQSRGTSGNAWQNTDPYWHGHQCGEEQPHHAS